MKKARRWILGVAISLIAFVATFWGLQRDQLAEVISQSTPWFLIPAAAVLIVGLFARARSWHLLLGEDPKFSRAFWALNEGYLLNSILPLRMGEVGRAYSVSRRSQLPTLTALSAVVVERLIDVAVSLAVLLASLSVITAPRWAGEIAAGAGVLLGAGLVISFLVVVTRERLLKLLGRVPGSQILGLTRGMDSFAVGLSRATGVKRLIRATGWNLAAWTTVWLQMLFLFKMFDLEGSLPVYMFISSVTAFGAALPSSPGALGVYEFSMVAAMRVVGYGQADGIGLAVTAHVLQLTLTGVFGAVGLLQEGESVLTLARRAQEVVREAREGSPA